MILLLLFLIVLLASFMTLVMNTEKILKSFCPYKNGPFIWNSLLFLVGVMVLGTVLFGWMPEQLCWIVPGAVVIAALVILFMYSGVKNRCGILASVAVIVLGWVFKNQDCAVWLMCLGSMGTACCSVIRVVKK